MAKDKKKLIVGTRGSALALAQTKALMEELKKLQPDLSIEILKIKTSGDRVQDRFLAELGGKGLFVREIETALLNNKIDVAVHSLKDVPSELPEGLSLVCFPKRRSPYDLLISPLAYSLEELPHGARIGTVSFRRRVQLKNKRSDLKFEFLRGNLETRIKKLQAGEFDAIILAQAGLERLGISLEGTQVLDIVPAPGQGTLTIECRRGDEKTIALLTGLQDEESMIEAMAERRVVGALGGDCHLPVGIHAVLRHEQFVLKVFLSLPDGTNPMSLQQEGKREDWERVTEEIIQELKQQGALEIVKECRDFSFSN